MEVGSKLALYKCEKQEGFYKATVLEYVYNKKKKIGGPWELMKYQAYIMDTSFDLEPANFSLNVDTQKYSFKNISNPEKSIIRVFDFKYEEHYVWNNAGNEKVKDDTGFDKTKSIFYINKITVGNTVYKSPESKIKALEKELSLEKEKKEALRQETFILKREIKSLNLKLEKANQFADKQKDMVKEAKNKVKQANKHTMVARRLSTIKESKLAKAQMDLIDAKNQIKQVKEMRKEEIIKLASQAQEQKDVMETPYEFGDI